MPAGADLIIGGVSLGIAAPAIISSILSSVKSLRELFQVYQRRDSKFEAVIAQFQGHFVQVENICKFLQNFSGSVNDRERIFFHKAQGILHDLLIEFRAELVMNSDGKGGPKTLNFMLRGKPALIKLHEEMEGWERTFYNTYQSMFVAANRHFMGSPRASTLAAQGTRIDNLLSIIQQSLRPPTPAEVAAMKLPSNRVEGHPGTLVDCSRVSLISPYESTRYLVESYRDSASEHDTREVAALLSRGDPRIVNILRCEGYFGKKLRYAIPSQYSDPRTLRKALIGDKVHPYAKHPLEERLLLMRKLASAVLYVHTARHVHKRIRAENVILFSRPIPGSLDGARTRWPFSLGEPFLLGFDLSRKNDATSERTKVSNPIESFYLPPDRQGDDPSRKYSMLDDVYSLGVLFLEIARWKSFVDPHSREQFLPLKRAKALVAPNSNTPLSAERTHSRLCDIAKNEAAREMGSIIADVILKCLCCTTGDQALGVGSTLNDSEGVAVGRAYIETVLAQLDRVSL